MPLSKKTYLNKILLVVFYFRYFYVKTDVAPMTASKLCNAKEPYDK